MSEARARVVPASKSAHQLPLGTNCRCNTSTLSVAPESRGYGIEELFSVTRGRCPPLKNLPPGNIPVITSSEQWNGVAGYFGAPPDLLHSHCITISANGSDSAGKAFWHPYEFAAVSDVLVCELRNELKDLDPSFYLYVCNAITLDAWRFDYFRKCTFGRLVSDVRVNLPVRGEEIDFEFIRSEMSRIPGYARLMQMLGD